MNKTELVAKAAEKAGITKKDTGQAADAIFEVISDTLSNGNKVQIMGFGSFEPKERAERTGRNPQTGEEINIPASTTVSFKPSKTLKQIVNG